LRTWHHTTRPDSITFESQQKWLGLNVLRSALSENTAEVEFIARFRIAGASAQRHYESSRFLLENGHWLYVDGEVKK
jgi:SEC-C motif-containing protein